MDFFWEKPSWESTDPHLSKLKKMPFQREWAFIPKDPGLYIIRGPRQIGKTCWLKSILSFYARNTECFYLSCEEIEDYRELGQILRSQSQSKLIILDEVGFIDGWDRAIKHFVDSGYNGILCVSGSHAYDLEKGADLMPGRFGGGGELRLLPMTFSEFSLARRQAQWEMPDRLTELKAYFRSGGFPDAVASSGKNGKPTATVRNTYLRWLQGDAKKLGKDPEILSELIIQIAKTAQTPVSFQTLAKKTSIGSPNTVIEYVRLLEASFALRTLYVVDLDTGGKRFRSDKKFYFSDPLIYWIALDLAGGRSSEDVEEVLAEQVANEHLARQYSRFGYFKNKRGEVDFVAAKKWCLEVKWAKAATNISKTFFDMVLPQKIVWTQSNFLEEWPKQASE